MRIEPRGALATLERVEEYVSPEPNTGCWLWTGANHKGYGVSWHAGRSCRAHRMFYELLRGPIPANLTIDHLCKVKVCVNPDHLEPVTPGENTKRRFYGGGADENTCSRGHRYDTFRKNGARLCSICRGAQPARLTGRPVFRVGDEVSWTTRGGTMTRHRSGVVVEVVPVGSRPSRDKYPSLYDHGDIGPSRRQESYVVRSSRRHFWPYVTRLTVSNRAEAM